MPRTYTEEAPMPDEIRNASVAEKHRIVLELLEHGKSVAPEPMRLPYSGASEKWRFTKWF